jgi:hypothetical protein
MVEPITIGLGLASLAGGLMGNRAQSRARKRLRKQEKAELNLQRGELADAREAFEQDQDRIARSIANALANRGISNSSIADETRDQFVAQRARGERALDRQHQRLEAGITTRNIQQDLQTAMNRANQLQNVIGLVGLAAEYGIFDGGQQNIPTAVGTQSFGTDLGGATPGIIQMQNYLNSNPSSTALFSGGGSQIISGSGTQAPAGQGWTTYQPTPSDGFTNLRGGATR